MTDEAPAVGIDLGTTYSCIGVFQNGLVKIIPNEYGHSITPSCVSFAADGHIVGDDAKYRLTMNPRNTVFEVKRLIGRAFDDPSVARNAQLWPFEVAKNGNKPIVVVYPGGKRPRQTYTPEEISAKVLQKMKTIAEKYLKKTVRKAVITVPAYFNESQRQATKTAGQIAGLEVLRIINEPEAAAMAYNLNQKSTTEKQVLIFDLGGGTFDVSVLSIEDGIIEVKAKCGDTQLGGSDFDNAMVSYCLDWFNRKHSLKTAVKNDGNTKPYNRLRRACELAKCRLSDGTEDRIRIEQFHDEEDFYLSISRDKFEELNKDKFTKSLDLVKHALQDAGVTKEDINEIILVGGSTRIPMIQDMLQEYFGGKNLNKSVNADEAVAYGAAIQAAILDGDASDNLEGILLMDITPLSLGLEIQGGVMSTIIKRNMLVPIKRSQRYTTTRNDKTCIKISVYQGERDFVKDNHLLGSFELNDIPKAPAGVPKIYVTFEMNTDGMLDVIAEDVATGKEEFIVIENCAGRLSNDEVERMIRDADDNKAEDEAECSRMISRNKLESHVRWILTIIKECSKTELNLIQERQTSIKQFCAETLTWLDEQQTHSEDQYMFKKNCLDGICSSIPETYKQPGNLPPALKTKYALSADAISLASMQIVNADLD